MPDPADAEWKARLRGAALARRDALDPDRRAEAARAIAARVLALDALRDVSPVAGFWPIRSEVDTRPLLAALAARGQALALPVVRRPTMLFRAWAPGDPLDRAGFGVSEPGAAAAEVFPEALLVPLACFDRSGGRVGYGQGHYDRALADLARRQPIVCVGLAFAAQEVERVPVEAHDHALDLIITERETIRATPSGHGGTGP